MTRRATFLLSCSLKWNQIKLGKMMISWPIVVRPFFPDIPYLSKSRHLKAMSRVLTICFCASLVLVSTSRAQDHAKNDKDGMNHDKMSMAHGNEADQAAARAVVDALFDAMRAGNGAAVTAVFADNARLMSTGNREGIPFVRETPIDGFAAAVDKAEEGSWDERIWNVMIHVDGNLATAWTPYAFYHDAKFSHCGVNAFQIARMEDGWKILQLTDTRQTDGCVIPVEVTGLKQR